MAIQADIEPGMSYAELATVAEKHGHTPAALYRAMVRRLVVKQPSYAKRGAANDVEMCARTCLCCGRAFMAETRFIRSCDACREKGSALGDFSLGVV